MSLAWDVADYQCPHCKEITDLEHSKFVEDNEVWEEPLELGERDHMDGIVICPHCKTKFKITVNVEYEPSYWVEEGEIVETENGCID